MAGLSGKNLSSSCLLLLQATGVGLEAHATTTPLASELVVTIKEVGLDSINNLGEIGLGVLLDGSESQGSCGLLADNLSEASLSLDNGIRNLHLSAESREPDDDLHGVHIVGDQNQSSLLLLDKGSDVLDSVLDDLGLGGRGEANLAVRDRLSLNLISSNCQKTSVLLGLCLRGVLVEQLEQLSSLIKRQTSSLGPSFPLTGVLVQCAVELVDGWGNLQALVQDALLSLKADILGPSDKASQVSLRRQRLTNSELTGSGLEKVGLGGGLLGNNLLLSSFAGSRLDIEQTSISHQTLLKGVLKFESGVP